MASAPLKKDNMANTPRDFAATNPPTPRDEARLDRSAASADRDLRVLVVSSFTDWLAIVCMTLLIAMKVLGPEFGWSIPALASGTILAKARLAKGGSTTALVFLAGPLAWKAFATVVGRTVLGAALLLLVGCGQQPTLQDARLALERVERLDRATRALCLPLPDEGLPERPACVELVDAFNALHGAP